MNILTSILTQSDTAYQVADSLGSVAAMAPAVVEEELSMWEL